MTKGGFFYHFNGKSALARGLIERYLDQDDQFFNGLIDRARSLSEDPLQQLLLFLKLMAEAMADIPGAHPGCLVASFTYESHQFEDEIRELNREGMTSWRRIFVRLMQDAAEQYPPRTERPLEELADMLTAMVEGGIVMSRCLDEPDILPNQILQFRHYVRLLFGER